MRVLLAVYDNDSLLAQPPHGIAYLAAAARRAGHEVLIWDAGVTHAPPEDLTRTIDDWGADVCGIGVIGGYWQIGQLRKLAPAVHASKRDCMLVLGGHGPAADPECFRSWTRADAVFVGESETSFVQWLSAPRQGIIESAAQDVDALPWPAWDLLDMSVYTRTPYPRKPATAASATVLSGRGCPFTCSFCFRVDAGFRPRKPSAIAAEVQWLMREYQVGFVNYDDELLTASAPRTLDVCEAIGPLGCKWMCNGRVNVLAGARGEEVLHEMREAGCVFCNLGIESLDDDVLAGMNKRQQAWQSRLAVERCLSVGISPGLNVMWGSRHDTLESLEALVQFLLEYDDGAQLRTIRPSTPYPGTPDFKRAVAEGRLQGTKDFYAKHVNSDLATVNWTGIPDNEFYAALLDANTRLIDNYHRKQAARQVEDLRRLYAGETTSYRGTRQT